MTTEPVDARIVVKMIDNALYLGLRFLSDPGIRADDILVITLDASSAGPIVPSIGLVRSNQGENKNGPDE